VSSPDIVDSLAENSVHLLRDQTIQSVHKKDLRNTTVNSQAMMLMMPLDSKSLVEDSVLS